MKNSSFKDFIIPLGLVLLTMWGINTYFFKNNQSEKEEHTFVAPTSGAVIKPINSVVDFGTEKRKSAPIISHIETTWGSFDFSTDGASLETAAFKKQDSNQNQPVYTVFSSDNKAERFFLIALSEKTPFYYDLVNQGETENAYFVTYQNSNEECRIEKNFLIHKNINKIDLTLTIDPHHNKTVQARVLFESPVMSDLHQDMVSSVVVDGKNSFIKTARTSLKEGQGWVKPAIFGVDNKYYLHALVGDTDQFVQRAYYKFENKNALITILEGPEVAQKASWNLSFYMGPKDTTIMAVVDERLDQAAHYYGWLASLSKLLLFLLKWLNQYFNNFGISIIVLTLLMKLVLFPFSFRGEKGMAKSKENQKKLAYIEQKYKNDPDKLAQERANFIRNHGLPGLGSCLPMLIQMPVFFALNRVLSNAPEMYKAPFLWMSDLSAADPYYVFPACIFLGMLINAFMVDAQQRSTMLMIAVVIGVFSVNFSAGLSLFIFVGTILGFLQAKIIKAL